MVRTPSNCRAMSTVASVEPSLTTITSLIKGLRVRTLSTSAIVFSSLYAAMMAVTPKTFTSRVTRARLQPADQRADCIRYRQRTADSRQRLLLLSAVRHLLSDLGIPLALFPLMKRPLLYATFLTLACLALAFATLSLSGCSTVARALNLVNPNYSIRDVQPRVAIALPL